MLRAAAHVVLMSGTPLSNACAADVYPLLDGLCGGAEPITMPALRTWNARYCREAKKVWRGRGRPIETWVGVSEVHGGELHALLSEVMIRRRKEEVLHELPPRRRSKVLLQLRPSEWKALNQQAMAVGDWDAELRGGSVGSGEEEEGSGASMPSPDVMTLFKFVADAKAGAVCEWVEATLLEGSSTGGHKTLLFAHHHCMHDALAACLSKALAPDEWVHITGKTAQAERADQLAAFTTRPRCRFAVLALTACGVGLNLACADTAVFTELCWTPSTLEQAEARIHRIGQQSSHVNVYYLLGGDAPPSPDGAMFGALVTKSRATYRTVDGGQQAPHDDLGAVAAPAPADSVIVGEPGQEGCGDGTLTEVVTEVVDLISSDEEQ